MKKGAFILFALCCLFSLCACVSGGAGTAGTDSGKSWFLSADFEGAKSNVDAVSEAIPDELPFGGVASGILGLVSATLGGAAYLQKKKKKQLVETLKKTVSSAAELMDSDDLETFVKEIKEIQSKNNTRADVEKSLSTEENIANKETKDDGNKNV